MTFKPNSTINPTLLRQIKSGKSSSKLASTGKTQEDEIAASATAIHLSEEHPAAEQIKSELPQKEPVSEPKVSRFGARFANVSDANQEPVVEQVAPEKAGRFDNVVDLGNTKQAKVNMAAVKALTPLVAAISFKPGSDSAPAFKSKTLAELISKVQKSTTDVTMAMGPYFANNEWARGQIMIVMSTIAAEQWEKHGKVNIEDIGACMSNAFRNPSEQVQSALAAFDGSDKYVEADSAEVARARLSVSISAAAWEINDWVCHEELRLKDPSAGADALPMPSRVFCYGHSVPEIVDVLLNQVIDESRAFELQVQSADLRLAHLQGTVRRMAQIAGAEYVTQTSRIFQWVSAAESEDERATRLQTAHDQLHTQVIPRIMEWTRANYASIEHSAQRMLLDTPQKDSSNETTDAQKTR